MSFPYGHHTECISLTYVLNLLTHSLMYLLTISIHTGVLPSTAVLFMVCTVAQNHWYRPRGCISIL